MAFKQKSPLAILEGGTNTQSFLHVFGVAYYDGSALNNIDPGTSGYVLTSNGAGGAASFQAISAHGALTSMTTDSGTATPSAGVIDMAGGSNINTSGATNVVTINLNSSPSVSGSVTAGTGFIATTGAITFSNFIEGALVTNASGLASSVTGTQGYVLTANASGTSPSFQSVGSIGALTEIDGDSGSATPTAGVITISGGSTGLTTSGSGSTLDLTGILLPANGGTGSNNAGTSGQILIGDGTKYVSSAPSSGTGITVGLGAGTMTVSTSALLTAATSSGTASVSSNNITFVGATGISTSASGSTVTITGTATSITLAGNSGSISGSSFTLSGSGVISSAASGSTVSFTSTAANVIHSSSGDATASSNAFTIVGSGGIATSATGSTVTITGSGVTSVNGNSGTATPSSGVLTVTGDGTVLSTSGSGSTLSLTSTAARVFHSGSGDATASSNAITVTGTGDVTTTATGSTLTIAGSGATSLASGSGTANVSSNSFTIAGGTGITTSASGSTVTITSSVTAFTWNNTTGATQAMAVGNGYVSNDGATLVTFTLPSTASVGQLVAVQGNGTGLWKIAQNASQTISFNSVTSTSGITGHIDSTSRYDSVVLICTVANNGWVVNQSMGNINVT